MINQFEVLQVAKSFSNSAKSYDRANQLQLEVGEKLFSRLNVEENLNAIIDIGCGTGILSNKIANHFVNSKVLGIDIAQEMVAYAAEKFSDSMNLNFLCQDANHLLISDFSQDLVFSNLMLQWSSDYFITLSEWFRVLRSEGRVLFATFGVGSLRELKDVWAEIDNYPRVSNFIDQKSLVEIMSGIGFKSINFTEEERIKFFNSSYDLMLEFKLLGAHNMQRNRCRGLLGKSKYSRLQMLFENYRNVDGKLPLTYKVYYVSAIK